MKRDIAEKWIADLRAGPLQAKQVLFNGSGHCCLGRLCVLAGLEPKYIKSTRAYKFLRQREVLPHKIRLWAGMKKTNGEYCGGFLAADNDSGKTFAEIAGIIEAHIDEL